MMLAVSETEVFETARKSSRSQPVHESGGAAVGAMLLMAELLYFASGAAGQTLGVIPTTN
jgi:hypothetical protein